MVFMDNNNKTESFVRLENANLVRLSIKQLSKWFTKYGNLVIDIKKLRDQKKELKKQILERIKELEKEYHNLVEVLPKSDAVAKIKKHRKRAPRVDVEVETSLESFAALREEFEKIKRELEEIE